MSNKNQAVQPQKMARGLKFPVKEVEGLYYLCSENKGADQLCGYHAADLRLCFCICRKFSYDTAHIFLLLTFSLLKHTCSIYCDFYGCKNGQLEL